MFFALFRNQLETFYFTVCTSNIKFNNITSEGNLYTLYIPDIYLQFYRLSCYQLFFVLQ